MKRIIVFAFVALMTVPFAFGQTVSLGISNPSGSTIRIFVTANAPGFASSTVTSIQFTILWPDGPTTMGTTITNLNGFNIVKSGSETVFGTEKYQQFVMFNIPVTAFPTGTPVNIMEIDLSGGSGTGIVRIASEGEIVFNEPYFEINNFPVLDPITPLSPAEINNFAMPVELTSFTALSKGRNVELAWKTATEVNSSKYEVEKNNGKEWTKVGSVDASGTSNTPKEYLYVDKIKAAAGTVSYRLKMIDNDGKFEYSKIAEVKIVPTIYALEQNYPNPFNPETKIQYSLPEDAKVTLTVYDLTGREVAQVVNGQQSAGYYEQKFGGYNFASGIYFYRIITESHGKVAFTQVKKMVMIK